MLPIYQGNSYVDSYLVFLDSYILYYYDDICAFTVTSLKYTDTVEFFSPENLFFQKVSL